MTSSTLKLILGSGLAAGLLLLAVRPFLQKLKLRLIRHVLDKTVHKLTQEPGGLCEIREGKVLGITYPLFVNAPATLLQLYQQSLPFAEREFIVHGERRYTYRECLDTAAALARALRVRFNVRHGDRVAILMSNIPEFCLAYIAATSIGAVAVTLNAFWEAEMIVYGVEDSGSTVLIADEKRLKRLLKEDLGSTGGKVYLDRISNVETILVRQHEIALLEGREGVHEFASVVNKELSSGIHGFYDMKGKEKEAVFADVDTDDDAMIVYTSGTTTGKPKGVVMTHRAMVQTVYCYVLFANVLRELRGPAKQTRCDLLTSPLFHSATICPNFLFAFTQGTKLVMMQKWSPKEAVELFVKEQVTYCGVMPTMLCDLMNSEIFQLRRDEFCLENFGTGGAACPSSLLQRAAKTIPKTTHGTGWGLTESNSIGTAIGGPEYLANPLSCGRPHTLVQIKVVDPATSEDISGTGQPGELWLKTPTMMREYWRKPKETRDVLDKDGWLRTGDIGKADSNGLYYIVDRMKVGRIVTVRLATLVDYFVFDLPQHILQELVIRGGENISCNEVADAIHQISGDVKEVCVFGIPEARLGESLCAAVVVVEGSSLSEASIRSDLSGQLAKFKVPTDVFIRTLGLPRGATGKVLKSALRKEYFRKKGDDFIRTDRL